MASSIVSRRGRHTGPQHVEAVNKLRSTLMSMMAMEGFKNKVSCCQMTSTRNKKGNMDIVEQLVAIAKESKSEMVCFPEAADFMTSDRIECLTLSEPIDGATMQSYRRLARNYEIWVSIGVHELIPSPNNDDIEKREVYNSHVVINNKGEIVAIYRKIHLFDVEIPERQIILRESASTKPGQDIITPFQTPIGTLGLATCYDLRFPEIGILLRKGGAQVISYPSAFTTPTGTAHWEQLLRARAIETQCYVIAPAQVGRHNEQRISHGRAMIVDPWGVILDECAAYANDFGINATICSADISSEIINYCRRQMPVFDHRRDDVYMISAKVSAPTLPITPDVFYFSTKPIYSSTVFIETAVCFGFTNIRCVVPGHVLVSTKRIVPRMHLLNPQEISDLFITVGTVQKAVEEMHNCTSSTIVVQDGPDAGQTIPHVHVHILPRSPGDFAVNDEIYNALANHDAANSDVPFRDMDVMMLEAEQIRTIIKRNEIH